MIDIKKRKRNQRGRQTVLTAVLLAVTVMSTACGSTTVSKEEGQTQDVNHSAGEETVTNTADATVLSNYVVEYTDRDEDADWSDEDAVEIMLTDAGITADGKGVSIEGSTMTITEEGTYVLSGTAAANLLVNAPEGKIHIVLNGVSMTSSDQVPVFYVMESKKVVVTLADGTENAIIDNRGTDQNAASSEESASENDESENAEKDAIYSKENLTFNGTGKLTVTSKNYNGITSKDELIFMEGVYDITAGGHGITGKDYTAIKGGIFTIHAGKDGIRSTNADDASLGFVRIEDGTFIIEAENDGIQAETLVYIMDGTFDITTGGGSENGETHTEGGFGGRGQKGNQPVDMPENSTGEAPADMPERPAGEAPADMLERPAGEAPADMPERPAGEAPADMPERPEGEAPADMPERPAGEASADMPEMSDGETVAESNSGSSDSEGTVTEDTSVSRKGMKAGTLIYLQDGTINLNTADDAVHSDENVTIMDGTYTIASGDDGIHAGAILTIQNGTITMSQTYEGLEGAQIIINDGNIDVTSSDDGVNVAGGNDSSSGSDTFSEKIDTNLTINGGTIHINASGDGLDSNGAIIQNGGNVTVDGPENSGNGALDYNTSYTMNGGTLFAAGSSGMMQSISDDSTVYCLTMTYGENLSTGDEVTISDESGNVLMTYMIAKSGNSFVYADEKLSADGKVTVSVNDEEQTVTLGDINTKVSADGSVSTGASTDAFGGRTGKMGGKEHMGSENRPKRTEAVEESNSQTETE